MDFEHSPRTRELLARVAAFMESHVYPAEAACAAELAAQTAAGRRWTPLRTIEDLKQRARAEGLWNLFLPAGAGAGGGAAPDAPVREPGAGLANVEYAPLAEAMGRVPWASEVFNCSAPDTGNMETLARYGSPAQQRRWLDPLLRGEIRSAFCMTEPAVASSDATNIESRVERDGDHYRINGRKWWISGACGSVLPMKM